MLCNYDLISKEQFFVCWVDDKAESISGKVYA